MKKCEIHLRLTESEFDLLCRYERENGNLSHNSAIKLLIAHLRRTTYGTSMGHHASDCGKVQ